MFYTYFVIHFCLGMRQNFVIKKNQSSTSYYGDPKNLSTLNNHLHWDSIYKTYQGL